MANEHREWLTEWWSSSVCGDFCAVRWGWGLDGREGKGRGRGEREEGKEGRGGRGESREEVGREGEG